MAIFTDTVTLDSKRFKLLHRSVGKKFSVQIDSIDGTPVDPSQGLIEMHKMIGGVAPTLAQVTDFLSMPGTQCVPVGSIRAELRGGLDTATVGFTVRTGSDVR